MENFFYYFLKSEKYLLKFNSTMFFEYEGYFEKKIML